MYVYQWTVIELHTTITCHIRYLNFIGWSCFARFCYKLYPLCCVLVLHSQTQSHMHARKAANGGESGSGYVILAVDVQWENTLD